MGRPGGSSLVVWRCNPQMDESNPPLSSVNVLVPSTSLLGTPSFSPGESHQRFLLLKYMYGSVYVYVYSVALLSLGSSSGLAVLGTVTLWAARARAVKASVDVFARRH